MFKIFSTYIYSTNIVTEYFEHGIYSPFFSSSKCSLFHNSNAFGSCIVHILYTECAKIKKIMSGVKLPLLLYAFMAERGQIYLFILSLSYVVSCAETPYCYWLASSIRKITIMQRLSACRIMRATKQTFVKYETEKFLTKISPHIRILELCIWFHSDLDTRDQKPVP